MDFLSLFIFLAVIGGIIYGLYRFKIGPFAPKTVSKAPMQRMGKEPGPREPRKPPETPAPPVTPPTEPPAAP